MKLEKVSNTTNPLMEMAKIGEVGKFTILVWTNDNGNRPHFHIVDSNSLGDNFHACVEILTPTYFHHTGEDTLNSRQKKALVEFLRAPDDDEVFSSNWQSLLYEWNKNNSRRRIDKNFPMPDYTKLQ